MELIIKRLFDSDIKGKKFVDISVLKTEEYYIENIYCEDKKENKK